MRKIHLLYILLLSTFLLSTSCRDSSPVVYDTRDYGDTDFTEIFEAFWVGMNNNYVFWDVDGTDWDKVYVEYKPLFAKLDTENKEDVLTAYKYFRQMTENLVDGHLDITFVSPDINATQPSISPSDVRWEKDPDFHEEIPMEHFYEVIPDKYLDGKVIKAKAQDEEEEVSTNFMVTGTIRENILYLGFNNFLLEEWYTTPQEEFKEGLDFFFDKLRNDPAIEGVVIDVRNNSGGDFDDVDFLLGSMVREKTFFAETRAKQGRGRLDYAPWVPVYITPRKDAIDVKVPIVVLVNLRSVSTSEILAMAVSTLPNGISVGERTWGGQGVILETSEYMAGEFKTKFVSSAYMSSLMLRYKDGNVYEGIGFTPDVVVKHNQEALEKGEDVQLDKAIAVIRDKAIP